MYQSGGKPSIAKFKSRLTRIREAAATGKILTERWNPRGRNAELQRQLFKYFIDTVEICDAFMDEMNRR